MTLRNEIDTRLRSNKFECKDMLTDPFSSDNNM